MIFSFLTTLEVRRRNCEIDAEEKMRIALLLRAFLEKLSSLVIGRARLQRFHMSIHVSFSPLGYAFPICVALDPVWA